MTRQFRLAMAQLNPTVGAIAANADAARAAWAKARDTGADLVAFPEMFLLGYQPQDLVLKPAVVAACASALDRLAADCADGPAIGIGLPHAQDGRLYNAWAVLSGGRVQARVLKHHLPNKTVFDEVRLFTPGPVTGPVAIAGVRVGIPVCEDAWHPDVCETLMETGAQILVVPNGSPYYRNKQDVRVNLMVARVVETGLPLAYVNMMGGQDDQVFDGGSFVLNPGGALAVQMPVFDEGVGLVEFEETLDGWRALPGERATLPDEWEADYRAMVTGLGDYMRKSGITRAILGLSGGIDSALVATIAADALGPDNVTGVMLPSEFTSQHSLDDAASVAAALGIRLDTVGIEGARAAVAGALSHIWGDAPEGLAEENIQSRLRGLMLMALSNRHGAMLLTTGNKSEVAVGYATIYGDMAGGYNPVKDLYKTRLFQTCRWRNANHRPWMMGPPGTVIPPRVIDKPPTAELRANQKDEDSLPPYAVLDAVLELLVEGDASVADVVAAGFDRATVKRVEGLLYGAEWKRFQSAPGPRLTRKAFWLDRRYPMVNRWRDGG